MTIRYIFVSALAIVGTLTAVCSPVHANDYREKGKPAEIVGSAISVIPPRDWNRLEIK